MMFSICKKMAAVIFGAVLFGLLPINVYAKACEHWVWCTDYVKSGKYNYSDMTGNAKDYWANSVAKGYTRGNIPAVGAVLVWDGWSKTDANGKEIGNPAGHVAIVASINGSEITVNHSNWNAPMDGCIREGIDVVKDTSGGNWSSVKVNSGGELKTLGFIYPKGTSTSATEVQAACQGKYCWEPKEASCEQANKWYITEESKPATPTGSQMCTDMKNSLSAIVQAPNPNENIPDEHFWQSWWRNFLNSPFNIFKVNAVLADIDKTAIGKFIVVRNINVLTNKVVSGNGMVLGDSTGAGYSTPNTDIVTNTALPDFVTQSVKLYNAAGVETYQYLASDPISMTAWFDNIGHASCPSDKKVEVHFYRSKGYKEDAHSDWQRVGTDDIKCYNIDPKDDPKEEVETLIPANQGLTPGFYNIVACADHIKDDHNNGGAFPEEHESNNCSTEAVFQIVPPQPVQCTPPLVNDPNNNQQCIAPLPVQCTPPLILDPNDNQKCITPPISPEQISAVLEVINTLLLDDPCAYRLTPATKAIPTAGGVFVATTTTTAECEWKLSSNKTWLTFTSAATGKGNNTINYTVAANPSYAERTGTITLTSPTEPTVKKKLTIRQAAKPAISIASVSVNEGAAGTTGNLVFTLRLNTPAKTAISVNYNTAKGTAVPTSDYIATSGTLTFAAGEMVKTVSVPIVGDNVVEPNEKLSLLLSAPTAPYVLQFSKATGVILNDD